MYLSSFIFKDKGCGYRAITVGLYYYKLGRHCTENLSTEEKAKADNTWHKIRAHGDGYEIHQINAAKEMLQNANEMLQNARESDFEFDYNVPFDSDMFDQMQNFLENIGSYRLMIIDSNDIENFAYTGRQWKKVNEFGGCVENDKIICLEYKENENGGHFNTITSIKAYKEKRNFCRSCNKCFKTIRHKCKGICGACGKAPPCEAEEQVICPSCRRGFKSQVILFNLYFIFKNLILINI